jgi:hypothetical protein
MAPDDTPGGRLTAGERRFVERSVRRRALFLRLCIAGLVIAVGLTAYYAYRWWQDPGYELGLRAVVVLLVLLNARQNLRQHRYTGALARLLRNDV